MKERLDKLVVQKKLLESREKARAYIMSGSIEVDGEIITKPSVLVDTGSSIKLRNPKDGYVSRGALKLKKALEEFHIDVNGKFCLDIGASTGGFTDCLLRAGASEVVAVDVGKNQIAYRLRQDPRVKVIEGFNARYVDQLRFDRTPDIVTIDVSFISIRHILEPLGKIIDLRTDIIALIKPQFELHKPYRGFRGVVRDVEVHREILKTLNSAFISGGYRVYGYTYSPLLGPRGNIEYFAYLKKSDASANGEKELPGKGEEVFDDNRAFGLNTDMVVEGSYLFFKRKSEE
jgi:23S rRNA (cytidine1920-2'-O)/16S rRNA (cytidine1409-2'-O)-methyltransferase